MSSSKKTIPVMLSITRLLKCAAAACALLALSPGTLPAQQQPLKQKPQKQEPPRRIIYVEVDIETNQGLEVAQRLLAEGKYDRAIKTYEHILSNPDARSYLKKEGEESYLGVFRHIRRALLALPEDARKRFLLRADPIAKRDYEHALSKMKESLFEAAALRHFCSSWGDNALAMLARYRFERADYAGCAALVEQLLAWPGTTDVKLAPLVARLAECYHRLRDPGALRRMTVSLPGTIANRQITAGPARYTLREFMKSLLAKTRPESTDAGWDWCTQGGDNTRTKSLPPVTLAATVLWCAPLKGSKETDTRNSDAILWNNRLFIQSMSLLFCIDINTGKLEWFSRLCSPEDYMSFEGSPSRMALMNGRLCVLQKPNRIAALDAMTGRILWRSSTAGEDKIFMQQIELRGPLLATKNAVYACAVRGTRAPETYLCCFDSRDGALKWMTFIAASAQSQGFPFRRVTHQAGSATAEIAESGGTVFCLTNDGAIAAVSAENGEMLWLRTYPPKKAAAPAYPPAPRPPSQQTPQSYPKMGTRSLFIFGRTLVGAPADSDHIMALNPSDGSIIWQRDTNSPDRLLCGFSHSIFGVRGSEICAISAQTGKDLWSYALEPAGMSRKVSAFPSGDYLYVYSGDSLLRLEAAGGSRNLQLDLEEAHGTLIPCDKGMIIASGSSAVMLSKKGAAPPEHGPVPDDNSTVDELIRALGNPGYPVRRAACEILRRSSAKILPQLEAAAKSEDAEVAWRAGRLAEAKRRLVAIDALREIAPSIVKEKLPHYLVRATEPDYRIRLQFVRVVCTLGETDAILMQIAPFIKKFLKDPSWAVRLEAALGLLKCRDSSGEKEIKTALASEELSVRRNTVAILAGYPSVAGPLLIQALDDKDFQVRLAAVNGLAEGGPTTALEKLGELLKKDEMDIRAACIRALITCGKELAIPLLAPALTDKAHEVRVTAVEALANMNSREAVKALIPMLSDKDEAIFDFVSENIFEYADKSFSDAVKPLAGRLNDKRRKTRSYAQQLLGRINTPEAINELIESLDDEDEEISERTAEHLLNNAGASAVPALAAKLTNEKTRVRYYAVQILAKIDSPECVPPLLKMAGDKDEAIAGTAFKALRLSVEPVHVPEILRLRTECRERTVRTAMSSLLSKLTKRVLIPGLIEALETSGRDTQLRARRILWDKSSENFGFHPDKDDKACCKAINKWREWWVKESVPEKRLEELKKNLTGNVPSERWRAAERLANLKCGTVIGALVGSLDEELAWVLNAKIEALRKLTGESFGYKKGLAPQKAKAVVEKWRNWWSKAKKEY